MPCSDTLLGEACFGMYVCEQERKEKPAHDLFAILAKMDRHSETVADKVYAALTPKAMARLSEYAFTQIIGTPVEFPTDSQWQIDGPSIDEILQRASVTSEAAEDAEVEEAFKDLLQLEDASEDWTAILPAMKFENNASDVVLDAAGAGLSGGAADDDDGVGHDAEHGEQGEDKRGVAGTPPKGKEHHAKGDRINATSKKDARKQRRKDKQKSKDKSKQLKLRFGKFDDQTTDSSDHVDEDGPKRTKVGPPTSGSKTCEPNQSQAVPGSAASGVVRHTTKANVTRMFSPRRHVQPLTQSDLVAIKSHGMKSRGAGFTEEEKTFFIEEMRDCQKQKLNPFHMKEVKKLIQLGRMHGFLMPICHVGSESEEKYVAKVTRFLRDIDKINPFQPEGQT